MCYLRFYQHKSSAVYFRRIQESANMSTANIQNNRDGCSLEEKCVGFLILR